MTISAYAIPGIKECDKDILDNDQKAQRIIDKVCRYFGASDLEVRSKSRKRDLVTARQWCFYFIRHDTQLTLKSIAEIFSGRDHTTAIHNIDFVKGQLLSRTDNSFKHDFEKLIQII